MIEDIDFITEELRRLYCKKKGKLIGKPFYTLPITEKNKQAFRKAAELCVELKADPEIFIDAQFIAGGDINNFYPEFLHSKNARINYHEYKKRTMLSYEDSYAIQLEYVRSQIEKNGRKVENILMDDDIPLSPWFRICISVAPIPEVIEKYRPQAKEEFNDELKNFLDSKGLDSTRIKR